MNIVSSVSADFVFCRGAGLRSGRKLILDEKMLRCGLPGEGQFSAVLLHQGA